MTASHAFVIGFLLLASYLACCLAFNKDTETEPESPTSLYERLQRERIQQAGRN